MMNAEPSAFAIDDIFERERDCWKSARERERRKARHLIRARVVDDVGTSGGGGGSMIEPVPDVPAQASIPSNDSVNKKSSIITEYLMHVLHKDRSKFSTASINRHVEILSQPHDIRLYILEDDALKEQTIQLFQSWFGLQGAKSLWGYLEMLSTFTFMEFAVWCGKYSIVAALLYGGINPCIRSSLRSCSGENTANSELQQVGTKVLKRFFDRFPLRLSTYIVKRVIDMRRDAIQPSPPRGNETIQSKEQVPCPVCRELISTVHALHVSGCSHVFCERCFWKDMLQTIDSPGVLSADDVVSCIVCGATAKVSANNVDEKVEEKIADEVRSCCDLTPLEKRQESLDRLNRLPMNKKALKWSDGRKRKKKASEMDHLASSWNKAALPSLGSTQDVRKDKFIIYVEHNSLPYVNACIQYGVDIEWVNEYGQTALYIAVWRGYRDLVMVLLEYGADTRAVAHGGSTIQSVAKAHQNVIILELINQHSFRRDLQQSIGRLSSGSLEKLPLHLMPSLRLTPLIPETQNHPGAGSFLIDNAVSNEAVEALLKLFYSIPVEQNQKEKKNVILCSERSYFCDAEGHVRLLLKRTLSTAMKKDSTMAHAQVYPHMRFLNYTQTGTVLAPHIDLCRVNPFSICNKQEEQLQQQRSTHTFILYLTDCHKGGETCLLEDVAGEGRSVVLAKVAPRRGRLLVFPHVTPHEGMEVLDVPKILLRGEVQITTRTNRGPTGH
jgi:hypothetical protein